MQKSFALFDFDGTLIHGDSFILFMLFAWRKKLCSVFDLFRFLLAGGLYAFGLLSPLHAKEMGLRFLKGRDSAAIAQTAEDFCDSVLLPRLYPQGVETLRRHSASGDELLLISASPAFYLEPLKQRLGLNAVLGTQFETDGVGRYTGRISGRNCRGAEKPLRLEQYLRETGVELSFASSSAYGDSTHDLPMLALCKNAYAINPGKKMLQALQTMDGVTVLRWKETA